MKKQYKLVFFSFGGHALAHQLVSHALKFKLKKCIGDFPGGTVVKNLPANAGDTGSIPGLGGSHMPRSN